MSELERHLALGKKLYNVATVHALVGKLKEKYEAIIAAQVARIAEFEALYTSATGAQANVIVELRNRIAALEAERWEPVAEAVEALTNRFGNANAQYDAEMLNVISLLDGALRICRPASSEKQEGEG